MARVFVVDDEPDIRLMLRINLEAAGHDVELCGDGATAVERIRSGAADVVLLDLMMPVVDGWSVLEALRGDALVPPVVVLSAKTEHRDRMRAFDTGAAEVVAKPFDPGHVLATIERMASLRAS